MISVFNDSPAEHWWSAGSQRSPRRKGTETLWMEKSFHGIRCLGRPGTLGTFPRRDRKRRRHLHAAEKVGCHLQVGQQEGVRGGYCRGGESSTLRRWCYRQCTEVNTQVQRAAPADRSTNKLNVNLQVLIFLKFPGEMLLVSFQKSCMKKLNPVPRDKRGRTRRRSPGSKSPLIPR